MGQGHGEFQSSQRNIQDAQEEPATGAALGGYWEGEKEASSLEHSSTDGVNYIFL